MLLKPTHCIFDYLSCRDSLCHTADIIIGFGHFDPAIPRYCAELYLQKRAPRILFTGGIGAGTADIKGSEGDYFLSILQKEYPQISPAACLVENRSTNTAENISFSKKVLQTLEPPLLFGLNLKSAILVANPYRQRRVYHTALKHLVNVTLYNAPPLTTFAQQEKLFAQKGKNLKEHLSGEIERLRSYGPKGFIAPCNIPPDILQAWKKLKSSS